VSTSTGKKRVLIASIFHHLDTKSMREDTIGKSSRAEGGVMTLYVWEPFVVPNVD